MDVASFFIDEYHRLESVRSVQSRKDLLSGNAISAIVAGRYVYISTRLENYSPSRSTWSYNHDRGASKLINSQPPNQRHHPRLLDQPMVLPLQAPPTRRPDPLRAARPQRRRNRRQCSGQAPPPQRRHQRDSAPRPPPADRRWPHHPTGRPLARRHVDPWRYQSHGAEIFALTA
jgi:hypothetical protein